MHGNYSNMADVIPFLAIGFLLLIVAWMLSALLYAWISKKVITYAGKESLPVKKMWGKYLLVIFVSTLVHYIISLISTTIFYNLELVNNTAMIILTIVSFLLYFIIVTWLILILIKDANSQKIGWKWSSIIAIIHFIISLIVSLILIFGFSLLTTADIFN